MRLFLLRRDGTFPIIGRPRANPKAFPPYVGGHREHALEFGLWAVDRPISGGVVVKYPGVYPLILDGILQVLSTKLESANLAVNFPERF